MKTNKQLAEETVKVVLALIALMRPTDRASMERAQNMAALLVETSLDEHVKELIEGGAEAAKNVMEGK